MSAVIERLRGKIRSLRLSFVEHLELDELLAALEREYSQLIQRINSLEQEVKSLRDELSRCRGGGRGK